MKNIILNIHKSTKDRLQLCMCVLRIVLALYFKLASPAKRSSSNNNNKLQSSILKFTTQQTANKPFTHSSFISDCFLFFRLHSAALAYIFNGTSSECCVRTGLQVVHRVVVAGAQIVTGFFYFA